MQRIYLDNAATTNLDPQVLDAMMPYLTEKFGNPSAIYSYGRETKMAIENARKSVAKLLHVTPGEIFFTSGGTESSNTSINAAINDLGYKHIITSPIEHHATLHTAEKLAAKGLAKLSFVKVNQEGHIDLEDLENLLANNEKSIVTLMHANNEIGNLLDIEAVGNLCEKYGALFHCDMVQTIGHYPIDLKQLKVHFASSAGHKFHGPKGVGILFVKDGITITPLLQGGSQERNMRAGTENLYGIVGYAKALEMSMQNFEKDSIYVKGLRDYMYAEVKKNFPTLVCNGDVEGNSLYTILNLSFPKSDKTEMLLFNLDMAGICVSGGSACSSGASAVSHVIKNLHGEAAHNMVPIRFSFSKINTKEEVDVVVEKLKDYVA